MNNRSARADFFDASALVKVFTDESNSSVVKTYWNSRSSKYTTPFCFYEAMNVLKSKWKYKNQLSTDQYHMAASKLTAWYGASSASIKDLDFTDYHVFKETKKLSEQSGLDLSDAFQIMSVKKGYYSVLINDSATVLVTADVELAKIAEIEGLLVWNITTEEPPI